MSPAASVFVTGAAILHLAGTGAAPALVLGGISVILASLLVAELGAAYPSAGGMYPGISSVLGRGPAAVAIALGLLTAPASLAFCALGFVDYTRVLLPALPVLPLAVAALWSAVLLSVLRIKTNAWITSVFLAAEMLSVAVLAVAAGLHPVRGLSVVLFHPVTLGTHHALISTPGWTMVLATIGGTYACSGSALALYFSEELRGASSRIGWVVMSVGLVGSITVGVPLILLTMSAPDLVATFSAEAPIARYVATAAGPLIATFTAFVVAIAIMNNIIALMLAFSRLLYATGRTGVWPRPISRWMSSLQGRFTSPWRPALALGIAASLLCLVGGRGLLVILSGELITPAMVIVAVLVGRRAGLTGKATFRSPLFPIPAVICLGFIVLVLTANWHDRDAGRPSLLLLSGIALLALGYHHYTRRSRLAEEAITPVAR
jgi:amino acid transporter